MAPHGPGAAAAATGAERRIGTSEGAAGWGGATGEGCGAAAEAPAPRCHRFMHCSEMDHAQSEMHNQIAHALVKAISHLA